MLQKEREIGLAVGHIRQVFTLLPFIVASASSHIQDAITSEWFSLGTQRCT